MNILHDDDFRDMMEYDILGGYTRYADEAILSSDDKDLLTEYAPKLFDTWEDGNTLKETMFNFVDKVYQYKFTKSPNNFHNQLNDNISKKYEKDNPRKIIALGDKLKEALDLMSYYSPLFGDHERIGTTIQDNFREILPSSLAARHEETTGDLVIRVISEIIENPEKYVIKKMYIPTTKTKNDIKEYLISLKLKNKSDEIINFIQAIK